MDGIRRRVATLAAALSLVFVIPAAAPPGAATAVFPSEGGVIYGTVIGQDHGTLMGGTVSACLTYGGCRRATIDAQQTYRFDALPGGPYTIGVTPPSYGARYVPGWFSASSPGNFTASYVNATAVYPTATRILPPIVVPVVNRTCLVSNTRTHLGSPTLQAAIDAAGAGDTLVVMGTCVGSPPSRRGDRGSSNVRKSLTIRGVSNASFGQATLDGGGAARVLFVDFFAPERRGFSLTIENLTITNGYGEDGSGGGGLLVQGGTVVIRDSLVTGNSAGVLGGGGIEASADSMTITHTTVSNNVSGDPGGGIYGGGTLTIEDSAITGNSTRGVGGGLSFNGDLTIRDSTVSLNRAYSGAGIELGVGTATLTNATVTQNTASYAGGGVHVGSGGSMTIVTSTVSGNAAGGAGGGIENRGAMTLVGSTVSANTGVNCGGGIANSYGTLDIIRSSVTGNTAICAGGIGNSTATMTITDSTVSGNTATATGGGILNSPNMIDMPTTLTIWNSTVRANAAHDGGGILNFGTLTIASLTTVGANVATVGGGILHQNAYGRGSVSGGCPVSRGGNVLYSPTNTPTDYAGFTC